jgi:hypothetical protein
VTILTKILLKNLNLADTLKQFLVTKGVIDADKHDEVHFDGPPEILLKLPTFSF